jgi:hypothetical protein
MGPDVLGIFIPLSAIVLSLSIPIIAIIVEHFTRKNKMKVIEKAIEKGVTLEGLSLEEKKEPRVPYRSGMVTLAVGLGICIFALFIGQTENKALNPLLGIAFIPTLVGIALIINDRINYDKYFKQDLDSPSS